MEKHLKWTNDYPLSNQIISTNEVFWTNPTYNRNKPNPTLNTLDIWETEERLARFASYLAKTFPETAKSKGIIESDLVPILHMRSDRKETFSKV